MTTIDVRPGRVLVTGGAGYIGSHMVWALLEAGEDVVVIDRLSTGFRWAISPEARFYEGDIADAALLARIFSENAVDSVIHFAGSIVVPDSVSDPLGYYENNTVKSRALIASVVEAGIPHFVFSSTAAVYGTPEVLEPVTRNLSSPETNLAGFIEALSATAAEVAPVAEVQAQMFGSLDTT